MIRDDDDDLGWDAPERYEGDPDDEDDFDEDDDEDDDFLDIDEPGITRHAMEW